MTIPTEYMGSTTQVQHIGQLVVGQRYATMRDISDPDASPFGGRPWTLVAPPFMALKADGKYYPHIAVLVDWVNDPADLANRPIVPPDYPVQPEAVPLSRLGIALRADDPPYAFNETYALD